MKKRTLYAEAAYILGIVILALGTALMEKAAAWGRRKPNCPIAKKRFFKERLLFWPIISVKCSFP